MVWVSPRRKPRLSRHFRVSKLFLQPQNPDHQGSQRRRRQKIPMFDSKQRADECGCGNTDTWAFGLWTCEISYVWQQQGAEELLKLAMQHDGQNRWLWLSTCMSLSQSFFFPFNVKVKTPRHTQKITHLPQHERDRHFANYGIVWPWLRSGDWRSTRNMNSPLVMRNKHAWRGRETKWIFCAVFGEFQAYFREHWTGR